MAFSANRSAGPVTSALNPGLLDKVVTLRQLNTTIDAIGGSVSSWEVAATVWGRWMPSHGREFIAAETRLATATGILRIRTRSDVTSTWRVGLLGQVFDVIARPIEFGSRTGYMDLVLKSVADIDIGYPLVNIFQVQLLVGSTQKAIKYPAAFSEAPRGLYLQLMVPPGGDTFTVTSADEAADGFTAEFSAEVPASGYVLSVQAFQYKLAYTLDLTEGDSTLDVVYDVAFPRAPRGVKVSLIEPDGGYDFTTSIDVTSPTAAGFTADFGALVPGPGYKVLLQISL